MACIYIFPKNTKFCVSKYIFTMQCLGKIWISNASTKSKSQNSFDLLICQSNVFHRLTLTNFSFTGWIKYS